MIGWCDEAGEPAPTSEDLKYLRGVDQVSVLSGDLRFCRKGDEYIDSIKSQVTDIDKLSLAIFVARAQRERRGAMEEVDEKSPAVKAAAKMKVLLDVAARYGVSVTEGSKWNTVSPDEVCAVLRAAGRLAWARSGDEDERRRNLCRTVLEVARGLAQCDDGWDSIVGSVLSDAAHDIVLSEQDKSPAGWTAQQVRSIAVLQEPQRTERLRLLRSVCKAACRRKGTDLGTATLGSSPDTVMFSMCELYGGMDFKDKSSRRRTTKDRQDGDSSDSDNEHGSTAPAAAPPPLTQTPLPHSCARPGDAGQKKDLHETFKDVVRASGMEHCLRSPAHKPQPAVHAWNNTKVEQAPRRKMVWEREALASEAKRKQQREEHAERTGELREHENEGEGAGAGTDFVHPDEEADEDGGGEAMRHFDDGGVCGSPAHHKAWGCPCPGLPGRDQAVLRCKAMAQLARSDPREGKWVEKEAILRSAWAPAASTGDLWLGPVTHNKVQLGGAYGRQQDGSWLKVADKDISAKTSAGGSGSGKFLVFSLNGKALIRGTFNGEQLVSHSVVKWTSWASGAWATCKSQPELLVRETEGLDMPLPRWLTCHTRTSLLLTAPSGVCGMEIPPDSSAANESEFQRELRVRYGLLLTNERVVCIIADLGVQAKYEQLEAEGEIGNVIYAIAILHILFAILDEISQKYWIALDLKRLLVEALGQGAKSVEKVFQCSSKKAVKFIDVMFKIMTSYRVKLWELAIAESEPLAAAVLLLAPDAHKEACAFTPALADDGECIRLFRQWGADKDFNDPANFKLWAIFEFCYEVTLVSNIFQGASNGSSEAVFGNLLDVFPVIFTGDSHPQVAPYTHTYIYIHIYIHTYICIYIYVHVYIYIYIYIHIHTHIYIYTHIYMYIYICIYTYICIYVCIHIYMCVCVCVLDNVCLTTFLLPLRAHRSKARLSSTSSSSPCYATPMSK